MANEVTTKFKLRPDEAMKILNIEKSELSMDVISEVQESSPLKLYI